MLSPSPPETIRREVKTYIREMYGKKPANSSKALLLELLKLKAQAEENQTKFGLMYAKKVIFLARLIRGLKMAFPDLRQI